jgi:hypothetical protein
VAGLTQLAGELMQVRPQVIALNWGTLKSVIVKLPNAAFGAPQDAAAHRQTLLNQYTLAFRHNEATALPDARAALRDLSASVSKFVVGDQQSTVRTLVENQIAALS